MIRLQRVGRKKSPSYRLVLAEKARDTQGKATEILGTYNPVLKEKTLDLKTDRITYWLGQGAQASETVHNLLIKEGVLSGDKKKSVAISKKRQAKIAEKKGAEEEAKKAVEEKEKQEAADAAASEEPAEEKSEAAPEKEEAPAPEAAEEKPADAEEEKKEA